MNYYSYVLRSKKNGIIYKGSTENLENRINYHKQGKVSFTFKYSLWELVITDELATRNEALNREIWYKKGVGRDWIQKQIIKNG